MTIGVASTRYAAESTGSRPSLAEQHKTVVALSIFEPCCRKNAGDDWGDAPLAYSESIRDPEPEQSCTGSNRCPLKSFERWHLALP